MSGLLDAMFGLEGLGFSDPEAVLTFARPIPAWAWVILLGVLGVLVALSYVRQLAGRRARVMLACARMALAGLLLLAATGPRLTRHHERIEEDWVIVMLDRSRSMLIPDAPGQAERVTRDAQLRASIESSLDVFERLGREKRVLWLGFDAGTFETTGPGSDNTWLGQAQGRRTAIGASLEGALQRVSARPVSGVVLFSDGRSSDQLERPLLRALESQRVPVFTVPLGSAEPIADVAVRSVKAPDAVFADDVVTASVELERTGAAAGAVEVELVDLDTGAVLDSGQAEMDESGRATTSLSVRLDQPGRRRLSVRLAGTMEDLISDNNAQEFGVEVVERPLRALYIDGYPRWEQRYVKNLLMRERSIRSSSLVLSANRRYLQEGDVDVVQLPRSVEEWAAYDVVIIGDLRPELLGQETLAQLREHVADRGAGLVWIAGPGALPRAWRNSPLADLIPVVMDSDAAMPDFDEPVTMSSTPAAEALGLLQLAEAPGRGQPGWPALLSDPNTGWSQLRWAQKIDPSRVKPGAVTLATLKPASAGGRPSSAEAWPGVLMMRFGAGASVYVATDETWRWRYGRGEELPERFWVPMIRQLARASVARSQRSVLLSVTPEEALVGRLVRISAELLDQSLIDAHPGMLRAVVTAPDQTRTDLPLEPQPDGRGRFYAAQWAPDRPGRFEVRLSDPLLGGVEAARSVRVGLPDDEWRRPETDHGLLADLAERTGGAVLSPTNLKTLEDLLPNRELTIAGEPEVQPLWDRPVVLIVLVLLLTLEWVGRRLIRLA
ncbi:MAG: hypothetical protein KJZ65_06860 [Phycisphaerales bacterium]|nr:hypothetical protein [Phycisphaerales bacterium]